jgi:hypothetical protein
MLHNMTVHITPNTGGSFLVTGSTTSRGAGGYARVASVGSACERACPQLVGARSPGTWHASSHLVAAGTCGVFRTSSRRASLTCVSSSERPFIDSR